MQYYHDTENSDIIKYCLLRYYINDNDNDNSSISGIAANRTYDYIQYIHIESNRIIHRLHICGYIDIFLFPNNIVTKNQSCLRPRFCPCKAILGRNIRINGWCFRPRFCTCKAILGRNVQ